VKQKLGTVKLHGEDGKTIEVTLTNHNNTCIELTSKGYGDCCSKNGHGSPAIIEYHEGRLRIVVWADINAQDPSDIIDLSNAKESMRKKNTPAKVAVDAKNLAEDRIKAANLSYETFDLGEDVSVVGSRGWETDGPDRLIRKFYYENQNEQHDDSLEGSFIVDFFPGTSKIEDAHENM